MYTFSSLPNAVNQIAIPPVQQDSIAVTMIL